MSFASRKLAAVPEEPLEYASVLDVEGRTTVKPIENRFTMLDPAEFRRAPYGGPTSVLKVALYASLAWNAVLALALMGYYYRASPHQHSRYARLPHRRTAWNFSTMYGSRALEDEQRADQMWEAYGNPGLIALSEDKARHWHLPQSQSLPWNNDYSLYTVSGMHSMSCLRKLRHSITLAQNGEKQIDKYTDLLYCADVLRQDIVCHADDTPMYTSTSKLRLNTGEGQTRMCKDWSKLEEWYEANAACYEKGDGVTGDLKPSKVCPLASKFNPGAREYFHDTDDH